MPLLNEMLYCQDYYVLETAAAVFWCFKRATLLLWNKLKLVFRWLGAVNPSLTSQSRPRGCTSAILLVSIVYLTSLCIREFQHTRYCESHSKMLKFHIQWIMSYSEFQFHFWIQMPKSSTWQYSTLACPIPYMDLPLYDLKKGPEKNPSQY